MNKYDFTEKMLQRFLISFSKIDKKNQREKIYKS